MEVELVLVYSIYIYYICYTRVDPVPTNAKVCVDAGISGSSSQVLVFPVWNMLVCAGITEFLG